MQHRPNHKGEDMTKRTYGTGSLFVSRGSWYGKWRIDGCQTKRLLGPSGSPGPASD